MVAQVRGKKKETMFDTIIGSVVSIANGNTFTMQVTHIGINNILSYKNLEIIRIIDKESADLSTTKGFSDKKELSNLLIGKKIKCKIHHRNEYNILLANIEII